MSRAKGTHHLTSLTNYPAEFTIYKWLRANTIDRFTFNAADAEPSLVKGGVWKERLEAEEALRKYLADLPSKAHHARRLLGRLMPVLLRYHCFRAWPTRKR